MFEAFAEWLKEKFEPLSVLAVVLSLLCCVTIIFISKIVVISDADPMWSMKWFLSFANDIAKIAFTAIVTGAVLKVLVVGGFFEKVLSDIIFGEKGLEIISQERRAEVWKALTARIYAPSFHSSPNNERTRSLYKNISKLSAQQIEYTESFYVSRLSRDISFKWDDAANSRMKMIDFMSSDIVPFDSSKEVVWKSKLTAGAGNAMADYIVNDVSLELDGEDQERRKKEATATGFEFTYYLQGRESYHVTRTREVYWNVVKDPFFTIRSPYIFEGGVIKITNMSDRKLFFQQMGLGDIFRNRAPTMEAILPGKEIRREIATVLLPRQGIQLVVVEGNPPLPPVVEGNPPLPPVVEGP